MLKSLKTTALRLNPLWREIVLHHLEATKVISAEVAEKLYQALEQNKALIRVLAAQKLTKTAIVWIKGMRPRFMSMKVLGQLIYDAPDRDMDESREWMDSKGVLTKISAAFCDPFDFRKMPEDDRYLVYQKFTEVWTEEYAPVMRRSSSGKPRKKSKGGFASELMPKVSRFKTEVNYQPDYEELELFYLVA